jgi:hypothetical protein
VSFGSHGYKPQARKPGIGEQSREYFFRAPTRTGANHSLFNHILLEFLLCLSGTDVFQPSFNGLKVAASGCWRSPVAFGWIDSKDVPSSEQSSFS